MYALPWHPLASTTETDTLPVSPLVSYGAPQHAFRVEVLPPDELTAFVDQK
jgi:hypothetical protein